MQRRIAFLLCCLACSGYGRRVQSPFDRLQRTETSEVVDQAQRRASPRYTGSPVKTLSQLLEALHPSLAFSIGAGAHFPTRRLSPNVKRHICERQAGHHVQHYGATGMPWSHALQRMAYDICMAETKADPYKEDFYERLGVPRGTAGRALKKAYYKAAQKYHPDTSSSEKAQEEMQAINEAYGVLNDPEKRQIYDQFGKAGLERGGGFGGGAGGYQEVDLGDIFNTFFGGGGMGGGFGAGQRSSGPKQGDDLRFDLEIDFQSALFGGVKQIRVSSLQSCDTCEGSGVAPGASVRTCSQCQGRGVVIQTVQTILGTMQQQGRCPTCNGEGTVVEKYCGTCDGRGLERKSKMLSVNIPAGVQDGNRLRVRGEGDAGPKGGPKGDMYVFLSVKPDPVFRREGIDIFSETTISYLDAILGTKVEVPTVDGSQNINVAAGTQPGTVVRIEGKGAPRLNKKNERGTHFVTVKVDIPKTVSAEEKELIKKLQEVREKKMSGA